MVKRLKIYFYRYRIGLSNIFWSLHSWLLFIFQKLHKPIEFLPCKIAVRKWDYTQQTINMFPFCFENMSGIMCFTIVFQCFYWLFLAFFVSLRSTSRRNSAEKWMQLHNGNELNSNKNVEHAIYLFLILNERASGAWPLSNQVDMEQWTVEYAVGRKQERFIKFCDQNRDT